jgi:Protein of unknown function (DUF3455)
MIRTATLSTLVAIVAAAPAIAQQLPDAIAAKDETVVSKVHAEGAQIYECKADQTGKLVWVFREPIATLIRDGKTVGRHYAGPTWELADGSAIVGKVAGRAPAPGTDDIPWLKLDVTEHRGKGELAGVTAVQRIDTQGGALEGPCETAGEFQSEPYAAEYVFLRKGG